MKRFLFSSKGDIHRQLFTYNTSFFYFTNAICTYKTPYTTWGRDDDAGVFFSVSTIFLFSNLSHERKAKMLPRNDIFFLDYCGVAFSSIIRRKLDPLIHIRNLIIIWTNWMNSDGDANVVTWFDYSPIHSPFCDGCMEWDLHKEKMKKDRERGRNEAWWV